ncbi:NAD(P)H-binding protein [Secundilactobacillus silagei]|nr:NAD(P)H-binding protein [Secundilactobacillus silagei]
MKIGIIGATGHVGQAIYKEAVAKNNEVTAIVRDAKKRTKGIWCGCQSS